MRKTDFHDTPRRENMYGQNRMMVILVHMNNIYHIRHVCCSNMVAATDSTRDRNNDKHSMKWTQNEGNHEPHIEPMPRRLVVWQVRIFLKSRIETIDVK
jgi:hypothetical protein